VPQRRHTAQKKRNLRRPSSVVVFPVTLVRIDFFCKTVSVSFRDPKDRQFALSIHFREVHSKETQKWESTTKSRDYRWCMWESGAWVPTFGRLATENHRDQVRRCRRTLVEWRIIFVRNGAHPMKHIDAIAAILLYEFITM
jgi:hypothetical protein